MNLFAALVNPNAPSTNTMGRCHPNHRVSGLVQRNARRKTCGLIWVVQLNLVIKFLQMPRVDWAAIECTANLYSYKTSAKPGEVCRLVWIATALMKLELLDAISTAFGPLAQYMRAQSAIKNVASLRARSGLNAPRIRIRTHPLLYAPRSGASSGSGPAIV